MRGGQTLTQSLTMEEKLLLKELQINPVWVSLIKRLTLPQVPLYKPLRSQDSNKAATNDQIHNWIYESGKAHALSNLSLILTSKEETK